MQKLDPKTWRADVLLDAVAVGNTAVRQELRDGRLVLHVPIQRKWYNSPPLSWFMPFRKERGFALDQFGEEVWRACDGEQTMEALIEEFAQQHQLRFHEARLAVTRFMQMMVQRGLVVLVFPKDKLQAIRAEVTA